MADNTNETPWYESMWDWLGNTALDAYKSKLQSDVAKEQADALAKEQTKNETIDFLGMEFSKTSLIWVAGGCLFITLLIVVINRK